MNSFNTFLALLGEITDPRRKEGKIYELAYVLLFSILAIVTGANSYRGIHTFMETHRTRLNAAFGLSWKRAPASTSRTGKGRRRSTWRLYTAEPPRRETRLPDGA